MIFRVSSHLMCVIALCAAPVYADDYDFRIYKLGNPLSESMQYNPRAHGNFRSFARQLGAGLSSVNLAPPETLGHSAFAINAELSVIDFGADSKLPTEGAFTGPMLVPSLHVRKGLPWSFELGARTAWIEKSRIGVGTLELKWALNEGFTYLPDIGVRGSVTKLFNTRDFDITTVGLDVGVGKQFPIAGTATLTPYIGWNLVFVAASTTIIDLRPMRTLAEADTPQVFGEDYAVYNSLNPSENTHNRFYGGLRFIVGVLSLGIEASYSILGRFRDETTDEDVDIASVLAINSTIGFDF